MTSSTNAHTTYSHALYLPRVMTRCSPARSPTGSTYSSRGGACLRRRALSIGTRLGCGISPGERYGDAETGTTIERLPSGSGGTTGAEVRKLGPSGVAIASLYHDDPAAAQEFATARSRGCCPSCRRGRP